MDPASSENSAPKRPNLHLVSARARVAAVDAFSVFSSSQTVSLFSLFGGSDPNAMTRQRRPIPSLCWRVMKRCSLVLVGARWCSLVLVYPLIRSLFFVSSGHV